MRTPTFLQFILIEARIDDLKAAKPHLVSEIDSYAAHDPTPQKKFVPWLISQHESGNITPDMPHIGQTLSNFETFRDRLSQKDHSKWDYHQLKSELDEMSKKGTGQSNEVTTVDRGEFDKRKMSVFHVTTQEAMKTHYGINSPHKLSWCIAADNDLAPFGKNGGYGPTYTIHVDNDNLSPYAYHPRVEKITNRFNHGAGGWGDATVESVITTHAPHLAPVLDTIRRYHHKVVNEELSRTQPLYYRNSDEIFQDLNLPPTVAHDQIRKLKTDKTLSNETKETMFENISKMKSLDTDGIGDLIDSIHEYTDNLPSERYQNYAITAAFKNLINNKNLSSDHIHKMIDKHIADLQDKSWNYGESEFDQKFGNSHTPNFFNHPNFNLTHTKKLFDFVHADNRTQAQPSTEVHKSLLRGDHHLTQRLYSFAPLSDEHIDHAFKDDSMGNQYSFNNVTLNPNLSPEQNERVIDRHLTKLENHVASTAPEIFVPSTNTFKLREETELENQVPSMRDLLKSARAINNIMGKQNAGHKVNSRLLNLVNDIHHATDYHKLLDQGKLTTNPNPDDWVFDDTDDMERKGNMGFLNRFMFRSMQNLAKSSDFVKDPDNVHKLMDIWENHPQISGLRHDTYTSYGSQYPDDFQKTANHKIAMLDMKLRKEALRNVSTTKQKISPDVVKRLLIHPTMGMNTTLAHDFFTNLYMPHRNFEMHQETTNLAFSKHMHRMTFDAPSQSDYTDDEFPNPTAQEVRKNIRHGDVDNMGIFRAGSNHHFEIVHHLLTTAMNPSAETMTNVIRHTNPFRDYRISADEQHTLSPEHKHDIVKNTLRNVTEYAKRDGYTEHNILQRLDDAADRQHRNFRRIVDDTKIKHLPNFGKEHVDAIMEQHDSLHRISSDENEDPHVRYLADASLARLNSYLSKPLFVTSSAVPDVKASKKYYSLFKPEHINMMLDHYMQKPEAYQSIAHEGSPLENFSEVNPNMVPQETATKLFLKSFSGN